VPAKMGPEGGAARLEAFRLRYRAMVMEVIASNATASRSLMIKEHAACNEWMSIHDREWYDANLPSERSGGERRRNYEKLRQGFRSQVENLIAEEPGFLRVGLRSRFPTCYEWLIQHDRCWLDEWLPGRVKAHT
jgi:hypothetical protein